LEKKGDLDENQYDASKNDYEYDDKGRMVYRMATERNF
jgi:hypothetical protein